MLLSAGRHLRWMQQHGASIEDPETPPPTISIRVPGTTVDIPPNALRPGRRFRARVFGGHWVLRRNARGVLRPAKVVKQRESPLQQGDGNCFLYCEPRKYSFFLVIVSFRFCWPSMAFTHVRPKRFSIRSVLFSVYRSRPPRILLFYKHG